MYNSMTLRDKYLEGDTFPVAEIQKKTPFKTRLKILLANQTCKSVYVVVNIRGISPIRTKVFAVSNCILRFFFALLIPKGGNKTVLVGRRIVVFFSHTLWEMH